MQILSSFSSDFQTLIKHQFSLYLLYELLMSVRIINAEVNIYLKSWTKFSLNNHQPPKALKFNHQPSKLEKN